MKSSTESVRCSTKCLETLRKNSPTSDFSTVTCTDIQERSFSSWAGYWKDILNSDALEYGGSGQGNLGGVTADAHRYHGRDHSISMTLPPFSSLFLKSES